MSRIQIVEKLKGIGLIFKYTKQLCLKMSSVAMEIVSYRPTKSELKKYRILKNIRNNPNIIITKPDKGNDVVILDRVVYNESCLKIINNSSKFKLLSEDPTVFREAKLQRLLRKLKSKNSLDDKKYNNIYPEGSQTGRFYGLPKLQKHREQNQPPPL